MTRQKPIEAKPQKGGALLSSLSAENVTIYNYTIKRDFRRNFDREIRSEGDVLFCPKMFTQDDVPAIPMPATSDPITLIIMARHPNGKTMVIVGTATQLWRYYGVEDPLYIDAGYYSPEDYYENQSVAWKLITQPLLLTSFASPARRWECETLNGYLILNNGVDLPMTYRITDDAVTPIYELRELAIASVGTIAVQNSHLVCMDIRQIKEDKFVEIMTPISSSASGRVYGIQSSGTAKATVNSGVSGVAGNTITASNSTFNSGAGFTGMVGRVIRTLNGIEATITAVTSPTVATINGIPNLCEPACQFFIKRDESFSDFYLDNALQPSYPSVFPTLNVGLGYRGLKLYWDSGETAEVFVIEYDGISGDPYFRLTSDQPIPLGPLEIENPLAYRRFTEEAYIDRYQNRVIWSLPDQPRRFGATYPATISPQSDTIVFDYPVKSIPLSGGDITLTGMKSGNLSTTGVFYDGKRMLVGEKAIRNFYADVLAALNQAIQAESDANDAVTSTATTLVFAENSLEKAKADAAAAPSDSDLAKVVSDISAAVDAARDAKVAAETKLAAATAARVEAESKSLESEKVEIQLSDAISSASRLEDLQDDGSAILKAVSVKTVLVLFTETSIFIARYSPASGSFNFQVVRINENQALFYRNTPILVNGEYILYAAESQFCRFDMTNQVPVDLPLILGCQDIFFDQATPENMERIFSVDNGVTSEILIVFPSTSQDKMLRLDYGFGTMSTSSADYTAGANVIMPGTSQSVFLMGTSDGKVLRYGLVAGGAKLMAGTASKSGVIVTAINGVFTASHIGYSVRFANGQRFGISKLISANAVEVVGSGTVASQAFYLEPASHHRRGSAYTSVLQSGGDAFGAESAEKKCSRHSVMLSSFSPDSPISVFIRSGRNINELADRFSKSVVPPETLIPMILSDYFLADRIEVAGTNNPLEITGRTFHVSAVASASFGRRDS